MTKQNYNKPLSDNVKLLGEILGTILKEQVGESLFKTVERIRSLSKAAHDNDAAKQQELLDILHQLSSKQMHGVLRSYSHFLNLANIAESHHRIRRTRWHQITHPERPQKGSLDWIFNKLTNEGISQKKMKQAVEAIELELVLTAHPTEVLRRTLIQKFDNIRATLAELDREDLTPDENQHALDNLKREITAVWLTDEIRRKKPTPIDEAKWGLAIIENSIWHALPQFLRELSTNLEAHTHTPLPLDATPIRFGSWMGGDRDGNPNVTHQVTKQVCLLSRWYAANLYEKEVHALSAELSMHACNDKLRKAAGEQYEPYRAVLNPLRKSLIRTRDWAQKTFDGEDVPFNGISQLDELLTPLMLCYQSLLDIGAAPIANGPLLDLIRRVHCFGLTLLRLDIRQESTLHTALVDAILLQNEHAELIDNDDARLNFLVDVYTGKETLKVNQDELSVMDQEVWQTFKLIGTQPKDAFGAYIISMASSPLDVIHVWVLQKMAGIEYPMPVVPLFETLKDLEQAGDSLDALLNIKAYKGSIKKAQEIMIGYSDSAKDAGIMAAGWALYQAQESLVDVAKKHKVELTLFHGRGGTVGRGGAPAHMAILSQPPGAVHGSLRITEQGEVIRTKFGFTQNALRTLELYASAIMDAFCNPPPKPKKEWRDLLSKMSLQAKQSFRSNVYDDEKFFNYFQSVTPVSELGQLFIGSRPQKRGKRSGIHDLRAIPWIFAWMQNRLMLPSWLGVGDALASLNPEEKVLVKEMMAQWPFFKSLLSLIEMVLAKADPMIATHYEARLAPIEVHPIGEHLRKLFALTTKEMLTCLEEETLLSNSRILKRSLEVREPYVYPINILQAECLLRVRENPEKLDTIQQDALLISISGIAAGMRNTG